MVERIGEFLTRIGVMKGYQVEDVLRAQAAGDRRMFGQIALELGYVQDDSITRFVTYLESQKSVSRGAASGMETGPS
jgi:hypothetical protein